MEKLQEKNKKLKNEVDELKRSLEWYMKKEDVNETKRKKLREKLEAEKRRRLEIEAKLRKVEDLTEKFLISLEKSQQESTKQIEEYRKEVDCLRGELQQVKVDRAN